MNASASCVASLHGVSKRYGDVQALSKLDLEVRRGELLAVLGANGAGKSTSIALLLGLIRPDSGRAELFGLDPQRIEGRRRIGVMLQTASLPPTLRVGELLHLTASYYPHPRRLTESAELAAVDDLLQRPYAELSGGQQRRVQFALALCGRPQLLFLDEPSVGMDIEAREKLWSTIRTLVDDGCVVVLTTHYLEEAEALADRVSVMIGGRLTHEDTVEALRGRVSRKRIRCITALSCEQVCNWPQVSEVRQQGSHLHMATAEAEVVVRKLLMADPGLAELEVQRAGLAEAFLELTRDADAASMSTKREVA